MLHSGKYVSWLQFALWVLVALALVRLGRVAHTAGAHRTHGFATYYLLARVILEGEEVGRTYDHRWFGDQIGRLEPGMSDINVNPPTTGFLCLPLALLPYQTARVVWIWLNLALFLASVCFLARRLALPGPLLPFFLAYCFLFQPIYANLNLGMIYLLLLVLLTASWSAYESGNERFLGLTLGCLVVFKLAAFLLLILLLRERLRRALAWFTGTVTCCFLATLPRVGIEAWITHLKTILDLDAVVPVAVTAYQSVHGFLQHMFRFEALENPHPLWALPGLASVLYGMIFAASLVLLATCKTRPQSLVFSVCVTVNMVLSPLALDYHYPLLLLPIGVLLARARKAAAPAFVLILGVAMFLIGADLPYRDPRLGDGFWALLAYPKLYGALALIGLLLWRHHNGQDSVTATASASRQSMKALTEKTARPGPGSP